MRMDLIQPFINSADAVLAQALESPISIENLSMEEEAYRRKGVAAEVHLAGAWPVLRCPRPMKNWLRKRYVNWPTRSSGTPSLRSMTRVFTSMFNPRPCTLPSKAARAAKTPKLW